jgi:hypothetical protein
MPDLTLESLAKRVEALEKQAEQNTKSARKKDWRRVVGMFDGSDFMKQLDDEVAAAREAERKAAREGESE